MSNFLSAYSTIRKKNYWPLFIGFFLIVLGILFTSFSSNTSWVGATSVPWYNSNYQHRIAITVNNSDNANALTNHQVRVELNSSNFNFSNANANGSDIRFTTNDGTTIINHYIESYNSISEDAVIWVNIPSIQGSSSETIYMYYGNTSATSTSNAKTTFTFFDDFSSSVDDLGYFNLGEPTTIFSATEGWETSQPHMMSMLELDMDGYKYWGYYGLQSGTGAIGLVRSNDLQTWDKYVGNPVFSNGRTPSVLKVGDTIYMAYTRDYGGASYGMLATSADGITFTDIKTLIPSEVGFTNQNTNLFFDPVSELYYLYWTRSNQSNNWTTKVRSSESIENLDTAPTSDLLMSTRPLGFANMLYYEGSYLLATEVVSRGNAGSWLVKVFSSSSPDGGFMPLNDNAILSTGSACMYQHIFDGALYNFYCKVVSGSWVGLDMVVGDLNRKSIQTIDSGWTRNNGVWEIQSGEQPDLTTGNVLRGWANTNEPHYHIFAPDISITNFDASVDIKLSFARSARLLLFRQDELNYYQVILYEDFDHTNNLYFYRTVNGSSALVGVAAIGAIESDQWYNLRVNVYEGSFKIYIDDTLYIEETDIVFTSGTPGLKVEGGLVEAEAYFDNFLIQSFADPAPIAVLGTETSYEPPATTDENTNESSSESRSKANDSKKDSFVCESIKPVGQPDLFQINRSGNTAKLYFTPVNDNVNGYHVIFGLNDGDERFGGINMAIQNENRGVQSIMVDHLDSNTSYSFKIVAANGCATGEWSNWLKADRPKAKTSIFYRYWHQVRNIIR